ncbi:Crp/Fnr family transcriptional regulator [Leptothrix sp. BB-4]
MTWVDAFGYAGALLTLATFSMKTMVRLRMAGIVANVAFISYGATGGVYPVLLLHLTLLPLNVWRLWQLQRLTRQIRDASLGQLSLDWLKPYSRSRQVAAGETLFRQGDAADELSFVLSGRFRAVEADVVLQPGDVIGELALVAPDHRRTQTVVCDQAGVLLVLTHDEVRQMYFQNPRFGFFFLERVAERLSRDARRVAQAPSSGA